MSKRLGRPLVAPLALLVAAAAVAAPSAATQGKIRPAAGKAHLAKASSDLLRARQLTATGTTRAQLSTAMPQLRMRDGLPEVEIRLSALDSEILDRLRSAGLEIDSFNLDYAAAYGRLDPARLGVITAMPEVRIVRPKPRVGRRAGTVDNQADETMNTDDARALPSGVDGSGVTIGILSDSFNATLGGTESGGACACASPGSTCLNTVTGMTNQGNGNLPGAPGAIGILDDCTAGSPNCDFLSDEGAAIGELMFDVAPGSGFLFHSAFNSPTDFADGIGELVDCGADVIVDDVFWTNQPFFQDGEIAAAAQAAVDGGVPYFSAAGNDATFGINDVFSDIDPVMDNVLLVPNGDDFHDFGGGDTFAEITLPDDCEVFVELQWSEPFENGIGIGASSDLDLYILETAADPASTGGTNILASSTTATGCGIPAATTGNPDEAVAYDNQTGSTDTVFLAIEHFCGSKDLELRAVSISFNCNPLLPPWDFEDGEAGESPIFTDAQIFGHPAAAGVVAVGAAFYGEIDSGGTLDPPGSQLDVEPFSSLGGALPFYFDGTGAPLPPAAPPGGSGVPRVGTSDGPPPKEVRHKPDVTGPDGTNNSFFGSDIGFDTDLFPNFFGTSAAAPNSAAIAALILDLDDELTPKALTEVLKSTSLDMEMPGFDFLSGFGFTDGLNALSALDDTTSPLVDDIFIDLDGGSFLKTPSIVLRKLQAKDTLTVGDGDYTGVDGCAPNVIFADGFESGDTSSWSSSTP